MLLSVYICWTICIMQITPIQNQNVKSAINHYYLYHLMAASTTMLNLFMDNIWPISSVKYVHRMLMRKHILNNNALFWDTLGSEGM